MESAVTIGGHGELKSGLLGDGGHQRTGHHGL